MTEPSSSVGASGQFGRPSADHALSRLVAVDRDEFADRYWGREPLLSPASLLGGGFADLLDAAAVDELVSTRGLRTPFLRVARNGSTLPERDFTAAGGVGAGVADQVSDEKLVRLFAEGATMVLQGLHRVWPPVVTFTQQLAAELGHPVQANAYVTPPQNQGFSNHYDVHDVFVLQIAGHKRWQIHPPVLQSPLRDQPWTDRREAVRQRAAEPPLLEAELGPGDCLYLPRGYLHAAVALGGVSTHLTLGVHSWTRYALAEQLVEQALRTMATDSEVRRSLPLGVDAGDREHWRTDLEVVRRALARALEQPDTEALSQVLRGQVRRAQRAAPIGPLAQLAAAEALRPETVLVLRPHLAATLDRRAGAVVLTSRGPDFSLDEEECAAVSVLLDEGRCPAHRLGTDLARRLLLAGLAVAE